MVMIRKDGKASKIAKQIMKGKGVKVQAGTKIQRNPIPVPFLQH